jgi:uncharacterized protein
MSDKRQRSLTTTPHASACPASATDSPDNRRVASRLAGTMHRIRHDLGAFNMPDRVSPQRDIEPIPLRLSPGVDLRAELIAQMRQRGCTAAYVVAGMGSLSRASLRRAGAVQPDIVDGAFELLTLSGTIGTLDAHLHASVADTSGTVTGGHVAAGCIVRTTAEILVVALPGYVFDRAVDPATGFRELTITQLTNAQPTATPAK